MFDPALKNAVLDLPSDHTSKVPISPPAGLRSSGVTTPPVAMHRTMKTAYFFAITPVQNAVLDP
jgi:hypothetical protein